MLKIADLTVSDMIQVARRSQHIHYLLTLASKLKTITRLTIAMWERNKIRPITAAAFTCWFDQWTERSLFGFSVDEQQVSAIVKSCTLRCCDWPRHCFVEHFVATVDIVDICEFMRTETCISYIYIMNVKKRTSIFRTLYTEFHPEINLNTSSSKST